ncbi:hypothetical protein MSC49_37560 (plasmid) [Methylosinus sp. C49]|uniref:hypothetical protein n=1 Tax=Methylosinus sp. C49 TaxID=2699395 RepID=UPI0013673EEB|nr:hypothetical protein [Methylosinus sp. C49]BBU63821.1 hypothetical protein MSC49_37560 [Methylosinus sp. C49]
MRPTIVVVICLAAGGTMAAGRDAARTPHFTARLVDIHEAPREGVEWLEIEFAADAISQVDTVLIRIDPWTCERSAYMSDANARRFVAKRCVSGGRATSGPKGWDVKLDADGRQTYRIPIALPPGVTPDPPFDIDVPISYAKSGEEDMAPKETAAVLTFRWTGRR